MLNGSMEATWSEHCAMTEYIERGICFSSKLLFNLDKPKKKIPGTVPAVVEPQKEEVYLTLGPKNVPSGHCANLECLSTILVNLFPQSGDRIITDIQKM